MRTRWGAGWQRGEEVIPGKMLVGAITHSRKNKKGLSRLSRFLFPQTFPHLGCLIFLASHPLGMNPLPTLLRYLFIRNTEEPKKTWMKELKQHFSVTVLLLVEKTHWFQTHNQLNTSLTTHLMNPPTQGTLTSLYVFSSSILPVFFLLVSLFLSLQYNAGHCLWVSWERSFEKDPLTVISRLVQTDLPTRYSKVT